MQPSPRPPTAGKHSEMREMVQGMLDAQRQWLPQFNGCRIRQTPYISVPENCERVPIPVDPALAIANRFRKLAEA